MSSPLATLAYLNQILANPAYAAVTGSGSDLTISAEIAPPPGALAMPSLVGATGAAGNAQFALRLEPTDVFTSPSQLPTDLTNTNADVGKYWLIYQVDDDDNVISSAAYIWWGNEFRVLKFGTQGPPGKYPVIAPTVTLLDSDENPAINVTGTGSAADPYLYQMELPIPTGPGGPSPALATFEDFAKGVPPVVGQSVAFTGEQIEVDSDLVPLWGPALAGDSFPRPYTVPESAFSSYVGINFSAAKTVGRFTVPSQPFAWKPLVWGQIAVIGLELDATPLKIGVEVRLGSPTTGTLVSRGFGNSLGGVVNLIPHTSSPGSPTTAMTPSNGVALVAANDGGGHSTLYVNLINDGLVEIADFNAAHSQLFVMACPASTEGSVFAVGALRTKVTLSAKTVTHGS